MATYWFCPPLALSLEYMEFKNIQNFFFKRLFLLLSLFSGNEYPSAWESSDWPTPYLQLLHIHGMILNHSSASGQARALSLNHASESSKLWWMALRDQYIQQNPLLDIGNLMGRAWYSNVTGSNNVPGHPGQDHQVYVSISSDLWL